MGGSEVDEGSEKLPLTAKEISDKENKTADIVRKEDANAANAVKAVDVAKASRLTEILKKTNSKIVLVGTDISETNGVVKLSPTGLVKFGIRSGSPLEGAVNDVLNGRASQKYAFDFPHKKQKFETDGSLVVTSAKGQVPKNLEEVKKIQELHRKIVIAQGKKEPSVDLGNGSVVEAKDFPKLIAQISTKRLEIEKDTVESEMESFKGKGFLDVNVALKLDSTAPVN